jgi:hypothetical protein
MFGFRRDGKRVKNQSLLFRIIPHIMRERNDSEVYFSQDIPIKAMDEYIENKAKERNQDIIYEYHLCSNCKNNSSKTMVK